MNGYTERVDLGGKDTGLYSEGSWFKSGHQLTSLNFFSFVLNPSKKIPVQNLKLCHDSFIPIPFQLIIH
jgi:hypothetical protein